ncbi:MAG: DUF423 domain-containing protein [Saprospiraceae bacterium]|nr:DUF423 domain-containing protein [Saprospiraceae bacterium]
MENSSKKFLQLSAIFGALAVGIGAFGAHGLKPLLTDYQVNIFEKGVHYQFFHTLALAVVGLLLAQEPGNRKLKLAGWFFVAGMVGFSGSLYLLACRDLISVPTAVLGPVTPLGGLCFLAGWVLLWLSQRKRNIVQSNK